MDAELARLYAEYERTLSQQHLAAADLDPARLDYHLPLLERLDAVDLPVVLDTVTRTFRFLHGLAPAERRDYKLAFDFRIQRADGRLVRLLQQVVVLEQDRRGHIWLILAVNDLLRDGSLEEPATRNQQNLKDGKSYLFVPDGGPGGQDRPRLTPREIEVLGLVAVGMASREIADRLFISALCASQLGIL
jgi:ATP/maltotriose-dependent transcriptional regulator MalT